MNETTKLPHMCHEPWLFMWESHILVVEVKWKEEILLAFLFLSCGFFKCWPPMVPWLHGYLTLSSSVTISKWIYIGYIILTQVCTLNYGNHTILVWSVNQTHRIWAKQMQIWVWNGHRGYKNLKFANSSGGRV
jgi:hypothetical protein